ncbi:MAG: hypothetical protein I3273_03200 [Candidatus Moeniiplasma glomeromycotorum]|nr:hypothetical protein [Candidatus Moeniiplasma glomeromycotorum]MCE8167708.1 hypothetical protein [Candidatus Moeniiplasma glomeromycotorum]MCE8169108.1 hypothetical protein [Candidatus Moeniiplasma glomeromycotorum]
MQRKNKEIKQNNTYRLEPPLKKRCLDCKKMLIVKFSPPHQQYSKKNDWGGWTGKKKFEGKYKCDFCIFNMFNHRKFEYLREVTDSNKRRLLRSYFYDKKIQTTSR